MSSKERKRSRRGAKTQKKRESVKSLLPNPLRRTQTIKIGSPLNETGPIHSPKKAEPTDEEVQKQIRETLEKLQGKSNKSKGAKYRRDKRDQHRQKSETEQAEQEASSKILKVTEFITVGEIATLMEISSTEIISACMTLGIMVTMNQRLMQKP